MPDKASYKSKGGDKDSATKNTFNPRSHDGREYDVEEKQTEARDPKRRIGQYTGAGQPSLTKK
ncbi:MAG: hypothetical protein IT305_13305 [Chloroflexi bacterium]|nr:hypothetical protein [Chloroflexota bacterium]